MFKFAINLFLAFLLLPLSAQAAKYEAGKHYEVLANPVRTLNQDKIEVMEMFSFSCVHCYRFEPMIQDWKKTIASDVDFVQSHVAWNPSVQTHAKIFYTIQFLGAKPSTVRDLNHAAFDALNVDRLKLQDKKEIAGIFTKNGISEKQFSETFGSFGVENAVRMADARARSYGVSGTPEVMVNGKYRVSGSMAGSNKDMLKVVDFLVEKERKSKAPKK